MSVEVELAEPAFVAHIRRAPACDSRTADDITKGLTAESGGQSGNSRV